MCLELLVKDIDELFTLYESKLKWLLEGKVVSDVFTGWKREEVTSVLKHFKRFYHDRYSVGIKFVAMLNDRSSFKGLEKFKSLSAINS